MENSDIGNDVVYAVSIDSAGGVWVGCERGLHKFNRELNTWTNYYTSNSDLPGILVKNIETDEQNRTWVGTDKGLVLFENDIMIPQIVDSSLQYGYVYDIAVYRSWVFISFQKNLKYYKNDWNLFILTEDKFKKHNISTEELFIDKFGILYCKNLHYIDKWNYETRTKVNEIVSKYGLMQKDEYNNLWILCKNILWRYDGTERIEFPFHIESNCFYFTSSGEKWIGTRKGLYSLKVINIIGEYTYHNLSPELTSVNDFEFSIQQTNSLKFYNLLGIEILDIDSYNGMYFEIKNGNIKKLYKNM